MVGRVLAQNGVGPVLVLRQIITDFVPGRFRTRELMEARRALYISVDSTQGNVEVIGFRLEID